MIAHGNKIKLFAGNGSPELAQAIAKELNMPLGNITVSKFSDGETSVQIGETVRGCDVFLIQSTSTPVNDNLVELLIMIDAFKRASAKTITAVIHIGANTHFHDQSIIPQSLSTIPTGSS